MKDTKPIKISPSDHNYRYTGTSNRPSKTRHKRRSGCCLPFLLIIFILLCCLVLIGLVPFKTNVLVLGIDYTDPSNSLGRSDTIILSTFDPIKPFVGLLSIPRDLWVSIPGFGENRINTAHYFGEAQQAGSGPDTAIRTVEENFGVDIDYYIRIKFDGFRAVVDAMDGVELFLQEPIAGYPAGRHYLKARKALAFVRSRAGSDDFFRMKQGQIMVKAIFKQMLHPRMWFRLPSIISAVVESIDTNIPPWSWIRILLALIRVGPEGIEGYIINRDMVAPFTTSQGAKVLAPKWDLIHLYVKQIFSP